jgi:uncharacterized membrane protein YedE/YeeE
MFDMAFSQPLIGGLLIGVSAAGLLLANGRIAGISGIAWGALSSRPPASWRGTFLAGLVLGAFLSHQVSGIAPPEPASSPVFLTVLAGLTVGFGVHLGSGCTSGHGVCGLGRLSKRSLVATLLFMAAGMVTVYILRHVVGVDW